MRTTINLDDELLKQAQALTGLKERSVLVREGLKALIERESARRLALLGGSEPALRADPETAIPVGVILVDTSVWIEHLARGGSNTSPEAIPPWLWN